ncbi:MAG: hypothetical protein WB643_00665 [Candidatus Bathyarchaeia archaeon]
MAVQSVSGTKEGSGDNALEARYAEHYGRLLLKRYKTIFERLSKM